MSLTNELIDTIFPELQIQIRFGKATRTPMLEGHLATPRAVCEGPMRPSCLLDRRNVSPGLVVAWTVAVMQRIEDPKLRLPRRI